MPIERIEAVYRVVTPMFCGGAEGKAAELRLPSFKGLLRWFWRAGAWSVHREDLKEIKKSEDALFGSASGGQSKVVMRLLTPKKPLQVTGSQRPIGEGGRYLGYGVMDTAGRLTRGCLEAPFEFTVHFRCRDLSERERSLLVWSLKALGLMGAMGSKSRKGYGSLCLRKLEVGGISSWSPPKSSEELQKALAGLYAPPLAITASTPRYTALSKQSRHILVSSEEANSPLALLDHIGREMMRYRSWGRGGRVLGQPTEGNFKADHDLMKLPPPQRKTHPKRIVFGLPHNYGKEKKQHVEPEDLGRRASPLLIHLHECGTTPVAVLSFLPALFLPHGSNAEINVGEKVVKIIPESDLWKPIEGLLNRFLDPNQRKEKFDHVLEVRP